MDLDECAQGKVCPQDADCINTEGSAICRCKPGFLGTGNDVCRPVTCGDFPDPFACTEKGVGACGGQGVSALGDLSFGDELNIGCPMGYRVRQVYETVPNSCIDVLPGTTLCLDGLALGSVCYWQGSVLEAKCIRAPGQGIKCARATEGGSCTPYLNTTWIPEVGPISEMLFLCVKCASAACVFCVH